MSRNGLQVDTGAIARCRTTVTGARHPVCAVGSHLADAPSGMSVFGTLPDLQAFASAVNAMTSAVGNQVAAADWLLGRIETTLGDHQNAADQVEATNTASTMPMGEGNGQHGNA